MSAHQNDQATFKGYNNENVLLKNITGEQSWVLGYYLETKQYSQWKLPSALLPKKTRQWLYNANMKVLCFTNILLELGRSIKRIMLKFWKDSVMQFKGTGPVFGEAVTSCFFTMIMHYLVPQTLQFSTITMSYSFASSVKSWHNTLWLLVVHKTENAAQKKLIRRQSDSCN